jgi:hypothetical protein
MTTKTPAEDREMKSGLYDPSERERAKQASRDRDAEDLISGRVSAGELQRRNAFISEESARSAEILEWKEFE